MATYETTPTPAVGRAARSTAWRWLLLPLSLLAGWLVWEGLAQWTGFPPFILPRPGQVWARFLDVLADGRLAYHAGITLGEVLTGLALGTALASVLGYFIAKSPGLERVLTP